MADFSILNPIDLNGLSIKNGGWERLATDPATDLFAGRMIYNTTDSRVKYYDGAAWQPVATLADLEQFSTLVGGLDASASAVPQAGSAAGGDIRSGDRWYVTTSGDIVGIGALEVGDMLIAVDDITAGSATATNFIAIQTNADLTSAAQAESVVIASIPANTATSLGSTFTTVHSAQFFDATGNEVHVCFDRVNQEVTASVALTNITASIVGI